MQLPSDFSTNVASTSASVMLGLAPYTELVVGTLLAVLAVGLLIRFLHH